MKRKITISIYLLAGLVLLGSCNKFLDVKPEDKFMEDQVFSSEANVLAALNGIYITMAREEQYGKNLTMGMTDAMAQYYMTYISFGDTHEYDNIANYRYAEKDTKAKTEETWIAAYRNILQVNAFLYGLNKYRDRQLLSPAKDSLVRGEAMALRALMHFDMLRLFGPMYSSPDSTRASAPYYTLGNAELQPLLPANRVADSVLKDLHQAELLLKSDPVASKGSSGTGGNDFFGRRNIRMNYYAVKALQARVWLYRGNKAAALAAATEVIDKASRWFPWTADNGQAGYDPEDKILYAEVLFGLFNIDLYTTGKSLFSDDLTNQHLLAPMETHLDKTYEGMSSEYRYDKIWKRGASHAVKLFTKYVDVRETEDRNKPFRYILPMIRMSEMYYIAAECVPNAAAGIGYLNQVRAHRNLQPLGASANLQTELRKEYAKEFWGEGQLFFFYKRKKITSVLAGSSDNQIKLGSGQYVVPLPDAEIYYRN
ncbi:RagB/SusD family nutrient uptake outer membrane protein [Chitinophaga solisilvae]|uniref:RagB/SusD family nutrient uptake outer membrane protein n=1 Tax=Chitinophaga solisilvae TaxID=1233460 RepID=UPI00136CBC5E|nr:RagB/SusD family nutrient uptake outer membrane protein [Chitinophaga solisilvae]